MSVFFSYYGLEDINTFYYIDSKEVIMNQLKVRVDDLDIQVKEILPNTDTTCTSQAETILFLHYSGGNIAMWEPSIPYFTGAYRLLYLDLRGHGQSSKPDKGYHIEDMAGDVIAVMNQLKIDKVHIVGSSMGAEVGLVIASNHPDKVQSLVCEGALYSEYGPYGLHTGALEVYQDFVEMTLKKYKERPEVAAHSIDALIDLIRPSYEESGIWNTHFEKIARYGAYRNAESKYITGMSNPILLEYLEHYYAYTFEDYYKNIQCPVLMLPHAEPESEKEVVIMHALSGLCKSCDIVHIENWQHAYGWILQAEQASNAVIKFIQRRG